jgi:hypothetical protein
MEQMHPEPDLPTRIPHWRQVFDSSGITPEVEAWNYSGSGTEDDPYAVTWIDRDPRNPMLYTALTRWTLMMIVAMAALMVSTFHWQMLWIVWARPDGIESPPSRFPSTQVPTQAVPRI